jgi:serine/threonine protein kinase
MRDQVIGNYRILEVIGKGSMGKVFKGIDLMLEREVAIKLIHPEYARRPDLVERFRKEAKILALLNHPNIVMIYTFFRQGDDFFMVMEFVYGETLSKISAREKAMPWIRAVSFFCQALKGIEHAHSKGIIHRDIKPGNMIITKTGLLKVMDFGIARMSGTAHLTIQGDIFGTTAYMSPEQIQGLEIDTRSDIYSLSVVLYKMLTGRVPFAGKNQYELLKAQVEETPEPLRQLIPDVPTELEALIARALAKQPEQRLQTVSEFRESLESLLRETQNKSEDQEISKQTLPTLPPVGTFNIERPVFSSAASPRVGSPVFVEGEVEQLQEPVKSANRPMQTVIESPGLRSISTVIAIDLEKPSKGREGSLRPKPDVSPRRGALQLKPRLSLSKLPWGIRLAVLLVITSVMLYVWQVSRQAAAEATSQRSEAAARQRAVAEEARRQAEAAARQQAATEEARRQAEAAARQQAATEEARRQAEATARQQATAEEAKRRQAEETKRKAAEEVKRHAAARRAAEAVKRNQAKAGRQRPPQRSFASHAPTAPVDTAGEIILSIFPREN